MRKRELSAPVAPVAPATPDTPWNRAPVHPGHDLANLLAVHEMTQAQLANRIGRPKKTINEIVKCKAAISAKTAVDLEAVFEPSADFWLAAQAAWDLAQERRRRLG